jgi:hypothetical protein
MMADVVRPDPVTVGNDIDEGIGSGVDGGDERTT